MEFVLLLVHVDLVSLGISASPGLVRAEELVAGLGGCPSLMVGMQRVRGGPGLAWQQVLAPSLGIIEPSTLGNLCLCSLDFILM